MKSASLFKRIIRNLIVHAPYFINLRYPRYMLIESSNMCNLRCPLCAVGRGLKRPAGVMDLDLFKKILAQIIWHVKMFNFGFAGEPLLNKDIFKMVGLAYGKGINSKIETNGMLLGDYIDDIFKSRLRYVNVALDGSNHEMINNYRVGADFDKIISGIRNLCSEKKTRGLQFPMVTIQILKMRDNQSEIVRIIELAKRLGAQAVRIKSINLSMGLNLSQEEKLFLADRFLPEDIGYKRYEEGRGAVTFRHNLNTYCDYPLFTQVILWNGDVILCCLDFEANFVVGNIKNIPLKKLWNSKLMEQCRRQAIKRKLPICRDCSFTDTLIKEVILSEY